jgi:Family of unknown function (DUF6152)
MNNALVSNRRQVLLLCAAASAAPLSALAHHGWSSFDIDRPVYLEGKVRSVKWQNPHAELTLDVSGLKLPADLANRSVPAQAAAVDAKAVLGKAQLPTRKDSKWEIELAPLSRMEAWKVAEIKAGAPFAVVGYTFKDEKGEAIVRAEYIWVDGKTYALRSGPA